MQLKNKIFMLIVWIGSGTLLSAAIPAQAGVFELGGSYAYEKSTYNEGSFTWSRRWSASLGYYLSEESELEFSYQDSMNRDFQDQVQDITYHDRVYSLNMNYFVAPKDSAIKPYFKVGVGQLNRDATGTYEGGYSAPGRLDQVTVILGAGLKAKFGSRFGLKIDATTYLAGGGISTWQQNVAISAGGSFYF
jgi:hypothetical protein